MKIIGGIDNHNHNPNAEATTTKAMRDAGYKWDEKKRYWVKGASVRDA